MREINFSHRYPNLSTLLLEIRRRPALFLGRKSVFALSTFLNGIWFAEEFHAIAPSKQFSDFDFCSFEKWVEDSFNLHQLTLDSFGLAAHLSGAEDTGFELWFSWYDTFCVP